MTQHTIRIGVDVGGTFTDFALSTPAGIKILKLPTTSKAPEEAILDGITRLLADNNIAPQSVGGIVHGTTLATNAIISRSGARTALVTTAGFRDVLAMADEGRFDQYDVNIVKPEPLIPRWWRYGVTERISADGTVLIDLDDQALQTAAENMQAEGIESVAICFLHAHVNADHEERARDRLSKLLPSATLSISSEVSPEIGEYQRFSTTSANAYVQPVMADYLDRFEQGLAALGMTAPIFMFVSNGGLCHLETAVRFPIRLVESGPAGGAIFAANISTDMGEEEILAFDMGGTTAKICLIENGVPRRSASFEMAREHMHRQGSGLPARIPVIDLVEIGAGGGSIANVDTLKRLQVGPESAGAMPGPASYGRGGKAATVTDANLLLGRLAPEDFDGSGITISTPSAQAAVQSAVGDPLGMAQTPAAAAICEVVEEQMAGAAREHGREKGVDLRQRAMVAFGGGGALHAAGIADKLGIDRIIIPEAAGIGSAIGFLVAQAAFEISRSVNMLLRNFDAAHFNGEFDKITAEARAAVAAAAPGLPMTELRTLFMRYHGQGHNLQVEIPNRNLDYGEGEMLAAAFRAKYIDVYKRPLDGIDVECVGLNLRVSSVGDSLPNKTVLDESGRTVADQAPLFDLQSGEHVPAAMIFRDGLDIGQPFVGPGLIKDYGTTIHVPRGFTATRHSTGNVVLTRIAAGQGN